MITLTKRGRIITITITVIMAALTIMTAIFAGLIYFRPNLYRLYILNRTNSDVVVTEILINGKRVSSGDRILKPRTLKDGRHETDSFLKFTFKKAGDSVLNIDVKLRGEIENRLSCALEDPNRAGCIFYANIRSENELACFCDSFADFYN
jgi:hypothetical protein